MGKRETTTATDATRTVENNAVSPREQNTSLPSNFAHLNFNHRQNGRRSLVDDDRDSGGHYCDNNGHHNGREKGIVESSVINSDSEREEEGADVNSADDRTDYDVTAVEWSDTASEPSDDGNDCNGYTLDTDRENENKVVDDEKRGGTQRDYIGIHEGLAHRRNHADGSADSIAGDRGVASGGRIRSRLRSRALVGSEAAFSSSVGLARKQRGHDDNSTSHSNIKANRRGLRGQETTSQMMTATMAVGRATGAHDRVFDGGGGDGGDGGDSSVRSCNASSGKQPEARSGFSSSLSSAYSEEVEEEDDDDKSRGTGYIEDDDGDSSTGITDNSAISNGLGSDDDDDDDDEENGGEQDDPLEPIPGEVKLVPSMFPDRPPTVFFEYPKELGMARFDNAYYSEPLGGRRLLFKTHWERNSVKNAFFRAGFSRTRSTLSWTASWGKHPTREGFRNLNRFQKVNHFPGSWCIGRKDRLLRTLARHKRELHGVASLAAAAAAAAAAAVSRGGAEPHASSARGAGAVDSLPPNPTDFSPDGFVLPGDRRAWLKAVDAEPKAIWIVKPPASSCGRGIRVISRATAGSVSKTRKCLVQRYIHNPMLIDGRKFDLRLYVLVTSMEPLRVYLFEEGLVRLSTKRYTLKNLRSRFTHLTNYSINKKSGSFKAPEDSDGQEAAESTTASKWALTFFWKYLEQTLGKQKSDKVKRSIEDVVLRTMAAADGDMTTHSHQVTRHRGCCYELFGFDVLLDEHLKPWLLEVNISPSLFGSSALDRRIKGTLMADIFHLVGFRPFDRTALRREERREARHIPGTRRAVRSVAGRPQDAWRKNQTPASVSLSELGEDEWEVIRDTEDEQHRAGHFRILYPTAENVTCLWPLFRNPRFLNGVLARWVLTGGLSNLANRVDIGLTAERLAAIGGPLHPRGRVGNQSAGGGANNKTVRSVCKRFTKNVGGTHSMGAGGERRWEETASNATTIISAGGSGGRRGARLARGAASLGGRAAAAPWLGAHGARPASSATSRASGSSSIACRRPIGRGLPSALVPVETSERGLGGSASSMRDGARKNAKRDDTSLGSAPKEVIGRVGGGGGSVYKKDRSMDGVPRLQLRRVESRVILGPGLLTLRASGLSARKIGGSSGGGDGGGGMVKATAGRATNGVGLGVGVTPRRASSAASSRPCSSSRGMFCGTNRSRSVAVEGTTFGIATVRPHVGAVEERRRPAGGTTATSLVKKTREVYAGDRKRMELVQKELAQASPSSSSSSRENRQIPPFSSDSRHQDCKHDRVLPSHATFRGPQSTTHHNNHHIESTANIGSTSLVGVAPTPVAGSGVPFPRPPCRARHPIKGDNARAGVDPLPAFAAALLPSGRPAAQGPEAAAHASFESATPLTRGLSLPSSTGSSQVKFSRSGGSVAAVAQAHSAPIYDDSDVGDASQRKSNDNNSCEAPGVARLNLLVDSRGLRGTAAATGTPNTAMH